MVKKLIESVLTLGKVAVMSRPSGAKRQPQRKGGRLIVMGNGPSLRDTIDNHFDQLTGCDTMAVNFAANTEDFYRLRPRHYVLTDPHFFTSSHPNVTALWDNLRKIDWEMDLHIPATRKAGALPSNISLRHYNMAPAEGYEWLCQSLYSRGLALPRPRNVLIPSIMEGIRQGYSEIWLVGADHTWPHTLYVDDSNRVVTVQPHFYEDNKKELDRIAEAYAGVRLHEVLGSMAVAFRSYHAVRRYADKKGVSIYNATPGSLIDAFERRQLTD